MPQEEILDLDSLIPEPKKIKFDGETITVNPPKMGEIMLMGKLGKKLTDANPETTDYEPLLNEVKEVLSKIIPELAGKDLAIEQVLALSDLLSKMAVPESIENEMVEPAEEKKT